MHLLILKKPNPMTKCDFCVNNQFCLDSTHVLKVFDDYIYCGLITYFRGFRRRVD